MEAIEGLRFLVSLPLAGTVCLMFVKKFYSNGNKNWLADASFIAVATGFRYRP